MQNVHFVKTKSASAWRKMAFGSWGKPSDPTVYGYMELPIDKALKTISNRNGVTITHFLAKAVAIAFAENPSVNVVLRRGKIYQRRDIDISLPASHSGNPDDLTSIMLRSADKLPLDEIARIVSNGVRNMKAGENDAFELLKKKMDRIPLFFMRWVVLLTGKILYGLNFWTSSMGMPRDQFGSVVITNIGTLGLDMALVPLVGYTRLPLLICMGAIKTQLVMDHDQVKEIKLLPISATIDHRLVDGIHMSGMVKTIRRVFNNPAEIDSLP